MTTNQPPEKIAICPCGASIPYIPLIFDGREMFAPTICDLCAERRAVDDESKATAARQSRQETDWLDLCPEEYRSTDWARCRREAPGFVAAVERYKLGASPPYFVGDAGLCKTRCAFELLRRQHFAGVRVYAISSRRFAWAASRQFDNDHAERAKAREIIARCRGAKILLLDDLGKERLTDTVEGELYDLLEHRTSKRLPIVWTGNSDGEALGNMLSQDRREAILRRLAQFGRRARWEDPQLGLEAA